MAEGVTQMSFAEMLRLRDRGEDRFSALGPGSPWGWLYGGELVAQGIRAAAATVAPDRPPSAMYCSFVRPGADGVELELEVERVKDGGAFSTRRVVASQAGKVIGTLAATFHIAESADDVALTVAPSVPAPEGFESERWSSIFERRYLPSDDRSRVLSWCRLNERLPEDPALPACALVYLSDDLFDGPPAGLLGEPHWKPEEFSHPDRRVYGQSLDLCVWLHRPIRYDDWLLLEFRCTTMSNACASVTAEVFDRAGAHLASISQQLLFRRR